MIDTHACMLRKERRKRKGEVVIHMHAMCVCGVGVTPQPPTCALLRKERKEEEGLRWLIDTHACNVHRCMQTEMGAWCGVCI